MPEMLGSRLRGNDVELGSFLGNDVELGSFLRGKDGRTEIGPRNPAIHFNRVRRLLQCADKRDLPLLRFTCPRLQCRQHFRSDIAREPSEPTDC